MKILEALTNNNISVYRYRKCRCLYIAEWEKEF